MKFQLGHPANPLRNRPNVDRALCSLFLKGRMKLSDVGLDGLFPGLDARPVVLSQLPRSDWSTPLADLVALLKIVVCARPRRLLEIGSFRGFTALAWAQHVEQGARIVAVDVSPRHGDAYRDTPYAGFIERRVGAMDARLFAEDEPGCYDLVFVDADHRYEGVRRDTEIVLPLLAPTGYLLWHDYANWGYTNGVNGVPEYLGALSRTMPIVHLAGTDLAIHCPRWADDQRDLFQRAIAGQRAASREPDPWRVTTLRG